MQIVQSLPPRDAAGKREGPGLITGCIPQSASVRDNEALPEVLAQQQSAGVLADELLADTIYGSDANVQASAALGVELISPAGGKPKDGAVHNGTRAARTLKERLAGRRAEQETQEWRDKYRLRSGLEGVHRALDLVTGMKRLRVRGAKAVEVAVTLKVTGWNIRAAAQILARRKRQARRKTVEGVLRRAGAFLASRNRRRRWN